MRVPEGRVKVFTSLGVTPPMPHYLHMIRQQDVPATQYKCFYPPLCPPFLCFAPHSTLCSHMSAHNSDCRAEEREHSGTWTSHLFTISRTGAWQNRGLTSDWLWSFHPKYDWPWLMEGWGSRVWNLEETRDCWSRAFKGTEMIWDRRLATMTFLSNDPNGRLHLALLFVYFVHTLYLLGWRACVSMCIVYKQNKK